MHYASVLYAMLAIIESKKMLGVFFLLGLHYFSFCGKLSSQMFSLLSLTTILVVSAISLQEFAGMC